MGWRSGEGRQQPNSCRERVPSCATVAGDAVRQTERHPGESCTQSWRVAANHTVRWQGAAVVQKDRWQRWSPAAAVTSGMDGGGVGTRARDDCAKEIWER